MLKTNSFSFQVKLVNCQVVTSRTVSVTIVTIHAMGMMVLVWWWSVGSRWFVVIVL